MKKVLVFGMALLALLMMAALSLARPVTMVVCDPLATYTDGSALAT